MPAHRHTVIPAKAGIQFVGPIAWTTKQTNHLDSRLRGNDGLDFRRFDVRYRL